MKNIIIPFLILIICVSCKDNKNKETVVNEFELGKTFYHNEKYDSSIIHFNNVRKIDTSNAEAYFYLSRINYKIDNYNEALKFIDFAIKNNYSVDSTDKLKLSILFAMEKYDDYIEYCDKLIKKNDSNNKTYSNKARALFNKSNNVETSETRIKLLKEALDNTNISLKLNKLDYEAIVVRGAIRYSLEDYKGAVNDFDFALKNGKNDSTLLSLAYRYKGLTNESLGNHKLAETCIDSAINYKSKDPLLYFNRGDIRISLNKIDLACEDYRKALELGDKDAIDRIRDKCQ